MTTQTALRGTVPASQRSLGSALTKMLRRPQFWFGLMVLVPILAWYVLFAFGPLLRAFWMATVQYDLLNPAASKFVGLKNFEQVFSYPLFWTAVQRTVVFALYVYVGTLPLALFVSLCLVSVSRGRNFYQFVIYLPVVVSYVAIALLFRMLMDPQTGQFNQILTAIGLPRSQWITGPASALPSIAMIDIWKGLGFHVVIITAGLLSIPEEMYDAAKVDGAGAWHRFRYVTFPLLGNTLLLESVIMVMGTLQAFTNGEVIGCAGDSCFWISRLVYTEAFTNMRFGFATASAFVLFIFILGLTVVQMRALKPDWQY
ncbi:MAG: sugar ABC transporter permease [Caldilineaceae bacterium]|nr:sugar ABC transporter permease [Caldilineaceae bacterium]